MLFFRALQAFFEIFSDFIFVLIVFSFNGFIDRQHPCVITWIDFEIISVPIQCYANVVPRSTRFQTVHITLTDGQIGFTS